MKTDYNIFPRYTSFSLINSPIIPLRTAYQNYKNQNKNLKLNKLDKIRNIVISYDNIEPKSLDSGKPVQCISGTIVNKSLNRLTKNFKFFSDTNLRSNKSKIPKTKYTYLFKPYPKKIEPLNLLKNEKSLEESVKIVNDRYLKYYHFPKEYTYQNETPRLIQNAFLKYTNEKRSIKLTIRGRDDYKELRHKIIGIRRKLYNPKNV